MSVTNFVYVFQTPVCSNVLQILSNRLCNADKIKAVLVRALTKTLAGSGFIYWRLSPTALKCTLVQALRLCTGRTAHRGSRGIALLFLDHGTRRGWGVSVTPRPLFTPRKDPVPIVQEAGWAPGPVWTGAENLAPHRDSIPGPSGSVASPYTDWATRPTRTAFGIP